MSGRVPKPLVDLYADLRDRRLLPVVALLVAAIVAVPIVLGQNPPAPQAGVPLDSVDVGGGAQATNPVVLADAPALRDYRERLNRFNEKNPFKQQLTEPAPGAAKDDGLGEPVAVDEAASVGVGTDTTVSESESIDTGAATPAPIDGAGGSGDPGDSGGSGGSDQPRERLYTIVVDVKVGEVGDTKKKRGVRLTRFLPKNGQPAMQYVQADLDAGRAGFWVSRNASELEGADCKPAGDSCEIVFLEEGEEVKFVYGDEGTRYRLKLLAVRMVEIKQAAAKKLSAAPTLAHLGG